MFGGSTYAKAGSEVPTTLDMEPGIPAYLRPFTISQTTALFLENNFSITPSVPDGYEQKAPTNPMILSGGEVYGLIVPAGWTDL